VGGNVSREYIDNTVVNYPLHPVNISSPSYQIERLGVRVEKVKMLKVGEVGGNS
jgi:hypothetical protein